MFRSPISERVARVGRTAIVLTVGLAGLGSASAQNAAPLRADPLDPKAVVAPLRPPSALAGYKPAGEVRPTGWREANDTVTRIGGWRAYAREAQAPAPAASAAPASAVGGSPRARP